MIVSGVNGSVAVIGAFERIETGSVNAAISFMWPPQSSDQGIFSSNTAVESTCIRTTSRARGLLVCADQRAS